MGAAVRAASPRLPPAALRAQQATHPPLTPVTLVSVPRLMSSSPHIFCFLLSFLSLYVPICEVGITISFVALWGLTKLDHGHLVQSKLSEFGLTISMILAALQNHSQPKP